MPKYLVQYEPGVPVPGQGFVRPGDAFDAPEGYVPSVTLIPLDKEAQATLQKEKQRQVAEKEKKLAKRNLKMDPEEKERLLAVTPIPGAKATEKKDEGEKKGEGEKKPAPPAGKRAADS